MQAAVIEQYGAPSGTGSTTVWWSQLILSQSGVLRARQLLGMPFQQPRAMSFGLDMQASIHFIGIHQWNPHRNDWIGIRIRPIRFILMPRHGSCSYLWNFRPDIVDRIRKYAPDRLAIPRHQDILGVLIER